MSTSRRQAALLFIFITIVLDVLALGIVIPVLPHLIARFYDGDLASAAHVYGVFGTAFAVMQFAFSPIQGALSDRFGRRPVILLSNFGLGLDYILMALAQTLPLLFIGRLVSGICAASISTANAYIADITPADRRAQSYGLVGAAFGLGFVAGPALGGYLASIDPRLPFWVAAGLSLANALYGLLILPESLPLERRKAFSWRRANPLASIRLLVQRPGLFGLASTVFLSQLAHIVLPAVFVLYGAYRYGWDEATVGLVLAAVGICSAVVQAGLMRRIVALLGEPRTLLVGLLAGALGFLIYALAETGWVFLIGIPVMALWGVANPAAQALMTQRVGVDEQGRLQGAVWSVAGIAGMIGPYLYTQVFAAFIAEDAPIELPGAPFLLAAILLGGAALLALRLALARPRLVVELP
jgi:DHA1 family tetracycline resistance protein-like MFS transporter